MRQSLNETYMNVAIEFSKRSTCSRRNVGSVIVDRNGYILSSGYNGQPSGFKHCIDKPCIGSKMKSGDGLDLCEAVHAEQNAIARLKEPFNAYIMYCTTAPCIPCTKLILSTSIEEIIFIEDYVTSGKDLFIKSNRKWTKLNTNNCLQYTK